MKKIICLALLCCTLFGVQEFPTWAQEFPTWAQEFPVWEIGKIGQTEARCYSLESAKKLLIFKEFCKLAQQQLSDCTTIHEQTAKTLRELHLAYNEKIDEIDNLRKSIEVMENEIASKNVEISRWKWYSVIIGISAALVGGISTVIIIKIVK